MRGEIYPTAGVCAGLTMHMRRCVASAAQFELVLSLGTALYDENDDPAKILHEWSCYGRTAPGCDAANVTMKTGIETCGLICYGQADCTTDDDCPTPEPANPYWALPVCCSVRPPPAPPAPSCIADFRVRAHQAGSFAWPQTRSFLLAGLRGRFHEWLQRGRDRIQPHAGRRHGGHPSGKCPIKCAVHQNVLACCCWVQKTRFAPCVPPCVHSPLVPHL